MKNQTFAGNSKMNFSKATQKAKVCQNCFEMNFTTLSYRVKRDEEKACYSNLGYGDLGCFWDEGPFDYLDMLPSHPKEINTAMMLFTRQNLEKAQFIEYNNITSVQESNYNATLDTKIIIHGFGSSCNRVWAREMRLSFLAVVKKIHMNLSF